jgi:hypothetical protein
MQQHARIVLAWAVTSLALGCISSDTMHLTEISTRTIGGPPHNVLAADVEASDCGAWFHPYASYATAVEKAIASVPGANALIDASFFAQEYFAFKICVHVRGDAVSLE